MLSFFLNHWALTACAVLSIIGYLVTELKQRSGLKMLNTQEAVRLMNDKNVFVLDVRTVKEVEVAQKRSLKQAVHIPLRNLLGSLETLKKYAKQPALVICAKGDRAHSAWSMLKAAGFTELYSLEGGLYAWQEQGLPTSPLTLYADKQ